MANLKELSLDQLKALVSEREAEEAKKQESKGESIRVDDLTLDQLKKLQHQVEEREKKKKEEEHHEKGIGTRLKELEHEVAHLRKTVDQIWEVVKQAHERGKL